jgi:plastocyanin
MNHTFALLYSNTSLKNTKEQSFLNLTKKNIQEDDILSKSIHFICVDNDYTRNIMKFNGIINWPVFIVKRPNQKPKAYQLLKSKDVFDEVYMIHQQFTEKNTEEWPLINWNVKDFKNPQNVYIKIGDNIKFKSNDGKFHTLIEDSENPRINYNIPSCNFDKLIKFKDPGSYHLISNDYNNMIVNVEVCNHKIIWNFGNEYFSNEHEPKEMNVKYGDRILFASDDDKPHNIWFANKNWKPMSQMVKLQKNMREVINIDRKTFSVPAVYHLVSTKYPETRVRIIIPEEKNRMPHVVSRRFDETDDEDIFEGIDDYIPKKKVYRFKEEKGEEVHVREEIKVSPDFKKIINEALVAHFQKEMSQENVLGELQDHVCQLESKNEFYEKQDETLPKDEFYEKQDETLPKDEVYEKQDETLPKDEVYEKQDL